MKKIDAAREMLKEAFIFGKNIGADSMRWNVLYKAMDYFDKDQKVIARVGMNGTQYFN